MAWRVFIVGIWNYKYVTVNQLNELPTWWGNLKNAFLINDDTYQYWCVMFHLLVHTGKN